MALPLLTALLVLIGLIWINKCHPKRCDPVRAIVRGAGLEVAILSSFDSL